MRAILRRTQICFESMFRLEEILPIESRFSAKHGLKVMTQVLLQERVLDLLDWSGAVAIEKHGDCYIWGGSNLGCKARRETRSVVV